MNLVKSITLKMKGGKDAKASGEFLAGTPGFASAEQVFPEDGDPEIAAIYVVRVDPARLEEALAHLRRSHKVMYANESAPRRAMR